MAPVRHGVVTPNCKQTSWDYWFEAQELKFEVSERSELNWQRYMELVKMASSRYGVVTPNYNRQVWIIGLYDRSLSLKFHKYQS